MWSYRRHQSTVNRIICGQQQFEDFTFSADKNGVILQWKQSNGACTHCLGDSISDSITVSGPQRDAGLEVISLIIEYLQILTLCFVTRSISWNTSNVNPPPNPFAMMANVLHLKLSSTMFPLEWMVSMTLILLFMMLFTSSSTFDHLGDRGIMLQRTLSVLNVLTMRIGFIPMLGAILRLFACFQCYPVGVYWLCVVLSVPILAVFVPTALRVSARLFDLKQIDIEQRWKWNHDVVRTDHVHLASLRTWKIALIQRVLVIIMVVVTTLVAPSDSGLVFMFEMVMP